MILGIDHVGLATDDADGAGAFLTALGMRKTDGGIAQHYGVTCEFWRHDTGQAAGEPHPATAIETVSPIRADSPVTHRLAQDIQGLYHIAFRVDDIETEIIRLRQNGFVPIDTRPRAGARPGMRVAFMYARRPAGLVIELVQYEPEATWNGRT